MSLTNLELNKNAKIVAINCDQILKDRFYSFGLIEGETVCVSAYSLAKNTIEVKLHQSKIALRASEASKITVSYEA